MPVQQIPAWARELGATPEGLSAFRRRRRFGGQRPMLPGGAGPQPSPMPAGGAPSTLAATSAPPRMSDAQIQGGIDSGSMSVKDAVAALDARKAGLTMPPPVKPPMGGDPAESGPIVDPEVLKKAAQQGGGPVAETPPIWVPPTGGTKPPVITGAPTLPPKTDGGAEAPAPSLPPVLTPPPAPPPERMAAFDFSPFEGQANYHQDPRFQQGWNNVFAALGGMDPETRARAEEAMAGMGPIEAGGARGMNAWIQAINRARGFEDQDPAATEAGTMPPGTNPPPPGAGVSADSSGITAFSQGGSLAGGMADLPATLAGTNPMLSPPPEALAAALGEAGMRRGGRPRPGTNLRPTLPNESGQARGRRGFELDMGAGAQRRAMRRNGIDPSKFQFASEGDASPRRRGQLNGGKAVVADESRQYQPRRRAPGPRNPRAGGY